MRSARRSLIRERHTKWLLVVAAAILVAAVALVPFDTDAAATTAALVLVCIFWAFWSLQRPLPYRPWFRHANAICICAIVTFGAFSFEARNSYPSAAYVSGLIALVALVAVLKGAFSESKRYRGIELAGEAMRRAEAGEAKSDGSSAGG